MKRSCLTLSVHVCELKRICNRLKSLGLFSLNAAFKFDVELLSVLQIKLPFHLTYECEMLQKHFIAYYRMSYPSHSKYTDVEMYLF